jgi:N-acetylneuraminate synthase/N,N'-diacetyllegionaminate synthase
MIVEAGVNHNGSLELAKKMVDAAVEAGADVIKFQSFSSDKIAIKEAPKAKYQLKTTDKEESQLDMLKKLELNADNFRELKKYCDEKGIMFLSTAHTLDTLNYLDALVPAYKIGSGDLTNIPALKKIAERQKPIILSTGMATLEEVHEAVKTITEINDKLILFHCTTSYPCPKEEVNLGAMETLMKEFPDILIGYSDHTLGIDVPLMAAKLGAVILEKHFTLDKNMPGPDHRASMEPEELKEMITKLRNKDYPELDELDLGSYEKKPTATEIEIEKVARKSLVAGQDIIKGTSITEEMIDIKRPGTGMKPKELYNILGKKAEKDIKKNTLLKPEDFY